MQREKLRLRIRSTLNPLWSQRGVLPALITFIAVDIILSMVFFKERFTVDGGFMVFYFIQAKHFLLTYSQSRYVILLLDFMPIIGAKLGLPMKWIMISWVLNYTLFYVICLSILALLRKGLALFWMVLFMITFTQGSCWFQLADEIWPSATLAILAYAYIRHIGDKPRTRKHNLFMLLLLFFAVFGHLVVILGILLVIIYEFSLYPKIVWSHIKKNAFLSRFFILFVVLRFLLGLVDGYERSNISNSLSGVVMLFNGMEKNILVNFLGFYIKAYPVIAVAFIAYVCYMVMCGKRRHLIPLFVLVAAYFILWFSKVFSHYHTLQFGIGQSVPTRWFFPANFLILYVLATNMQSIRKHIGILFIFGIAFTTFHRIILAKPNTNTVKQYQTLFSVAYEKNVDKIYIREEQLCSTAHANYLITVNTNSIIYSSIDTIPGQVHVAIDWGQSQSDIGSGDQIFMSEVSSIPVEQLNKRYFHFSEAPYLKLEDDFTDCQFD